MKFEVKTEKPVKIEVDVDGTKHIIEFYPSDLKTRRAFFEVYEDLKAYKPAEIIPEKDENGVDNSELQNVREMVRFTEYFAERFDRVFGAGTADLIMNGQCCPGEMVRFLCETAKFFQRESEELIRSYTKPDNGGVME